MSEVVDSAKKAVSTVDLALSAVGLLKGLALIFGVVLVEWARKKQKLAENQAAVSQSNLSVKVEQDAIQKANNEKTSSEIIDDFLGD